MVMSYIYKNSKFQRFFKTFNNASKNDLTSGHIFLNHNWRSYIFTTVIPF